MDLDILWMPGLLLFPTGLLEVGWAVGLKYTEGFTRPMATLLTVISVIAVWDCRSIPEDPFSGNCLRDLDRYWNGRHGRAIRSSRHQN